MIGTKQQLAAVIFCLVVAVVCLFAAADGQTKDARNKETHSKVAQNTAKSTPQGSQLFSAYCASCHGLDGHGGERAPDIISRQELQKASNVDLAKIIRDGVAGTGMPPFGSLGEPKIRALVEHIRDLQGNGSASALPGSPEQGKNLFFGKAACSGCHMVNGAGGFIGADLTSYAHGKSAVEVSTAITKPNSAGLRGTVVSATTKDGANIRGIVRNEDNFSLQLQTEDGAFHFFEKSALQNIERIPEPLMPGDYASRLTPAELNDIISYLISAGRNAPEQKRNPEDAEW